MAPIKYSYKHVPTIRRFSKSRKRIRGLMGPFGSGKSSGCVMELVKIASRQKMIDGKRRARFAVIRNTFRQLEDTTIRTFHEWLPPGPYGAGDYLKSEHVYKINRLDPSLEIEVMFRALDRPEHVANLLSLELTAAWVNEAREVPWPIIRALQGRIGRYPAKKDGGAVDAGLILDTNPPDDDSWWYLVFEDKVDPVKREPLRDPSIMALFKQPSGRSKKAENLPYLPTNYYQDLMAGADEDFIRVYVDAEYGLVKDGKPVYPEYHDTIHCAEVEPIKETVIKRGWDFGLTPSCVLSQLTPKGQWNIIDELVGDDVGIESFADVVLEHCSEHYQGFKFTDWGDPAGSQRTQTDEKTCFDILHGKGIQIQPSEQSLTLRIESVKKALNTMRNGKPILQIHSRCKTLRKGFQGRYQYKRFKIAGAEERYHDKPDKNAYSHPHDGLQYVAVKIFGDSVKSITESSVKPIRYPKDYLAWVV